MEGFSGRGHAPVILITNDGAARSFIIDLVNSPSQVFERYEAHATSLRQQLDDVSVVDDRITIAVPAHSVTTLVGIEAVVQAPRAYLVVGDAANPTPRDEALQTALSAEGFDPLMLSQALTAGQQSATIRKRHPVDLGGAACYVLAESVTDPQVAQAHDMVMAPVICLADDLRDELGLVADSIVLPGASLDLRRTIDPPASMLDGGKPRALGYRRHLGTSTAAEVATAARIALPQGGAVTLATPGDNLPPLITQAAAADPSPSLVW